MASYLPVLTIAGSDSSGGAGIQADLKTISSLGCYGMSAITAITAQNTTGVSAIQGIDPDIVTAQIKMVLTDIQPKAIKTGMLFSTRVVNAVAHALNEYPSITAMPLIVDPVMVSTSGSKLITDDAIEAVTNLIFPLATLITPNLAEAATLTGVTDPEKQWQLFREMGCKNVLLKGGDSTRSDIKVDFLGLEGAKQLIPIEAPAVMTANTHGTGCTLSAAIASFIAQGLDLLEAVKRAKIYITRALQEGAKVEIGQGHGPVNHFFSPIPLIIKDAGNDKQ